METIIKIKPKELNTRLIDKIKKFAGKDEASEILISIKRSISKKSLLKKETPPQTKARIDRAIENAEKGKNLVRFSGEEFETLFGLLSKKAS